VETTSQKTCCARVVPHYPGYEAMMWYYHFTYGAGGKKRPGLLPGEITTKFGIGGYSALYIEIKPINCIIFFLYPFINRWHIKTFIKTFI
jgi:hypothetical protein